MTAQRITRFPPAYCEGGWSKQGPELAPIDRAAFGLPDPGMPVEGTAEYRRKFTWLGKMAREASLAQAGRALLSDRNLGDLNPRFQPIAQQFLDRCNAALAPSSVRPIVTWRDAADQNQAEACGLSKAGAGASPHNCVDANGNPASLAMDFSVFAPDGAYITRGQDARYEQAGKIAVELELVYGGNWTIESDGCDPDWDHVEMAD